MVLVTQSWPGPFTCGLGGGGGGGGMEPPLPQTFSLATHALSVFTIGPEVPSFLVSVPKAQGAATGGRSSIAFISMSSSSKSSWYKIGRSFWSHCHMSPRVDFLGQHRLHVSDMPDLPFGSSLPKKTSHMQFSVFCG